MRRETNMKAGPIYREHRVHISRLPSERWLCNIVKLGKKKGMTKDSLTLAVTRVPGEYDSEEEALRAAKRYIDEENERRQDE